MASIGNLFIAGMDKFNGIYKCGIAYELSTESPISFFYETTQQGWLVEFLEKSSFVVARTMQELSYEQVHSDGFTAIQEALDILSIKGIYSANLAAPANYNISIYCENNNSILSVYNMIDFPMGVKLEITQFDSSGKKVEALSPPEPIWNESFRYYRLSQCSSDLFEAYRNLFLSFEALLNSICKKKSNEKEGEWLRRALTTINFKVSLSSSTPTGNEEPVSYIITSQYKNIRCKLQHAKFPNAQLPHSQPSLQDVQQAYSELVRIWRQIAGAYFNVATGGSVITYRGFSNMMKGIFEPAVYLDFTPDNTPPRKSDTQINKNETPSYRFEKTAYIGSIKPGVVRISGNESINKSLGKYNDPICKICILIKEAPFSIAYIKSGLYISGVEEFECISDIRLINSSQPKIEFDT
ncbi:hypothetical protein [Leminorella grimontii]|uniref:hypothetical protein n=1 Tax=Leminorella grimontii TaxID=82981 RepID=UPI002089DC99|nr:hypothetical protein [Leminorella grimontii]GKX59122.1 hypothetical protein SOASR031_14370 [Leminorella grimontii]